MSGGGLHPRGTIVALVPVRSLAEGKTRLSDALSPEAREALTRRMLRGVVRAALDSSTVATVAVVSPDPAALVVAAVEGPGVAPLLQDPDRPGLNAAIAQGRDWARRRGAAGLLVLFADLPLLSPDDVRNLVRRDAPVVLAPDRHGTGTNALLLRFGGTEWGRDGAGESGDGVAEGFRFAFGPGSYARHADEAHRLGLDVATALTTGTAFDLDTPDDLHALLGDGGWEMGDRVEAGAAPGDGWSDR